MKKLLPCLILILLGLPACRKNSPKPDRIPNQQTDTPAVTAPTGTAVISGKVGPPDIAGQSKVVLINLQSFTRDTIAPDAEGGFKFSAVLPGDYNVTVKMPDHSDAEITPVKLTAGQAIDLETITFTDNGFSITGTGSITGTVTPATAVSRVSVIEKSGLHAYNGSIIAYRGTINAAGSLL